MRTKIYTITLFLLISIFTSAQNPGWLWAKRAGGTGFDNAFNVAVDASGNVYMVGTFNSPTITFGTTTLTNAGSGTTTDIFLVKYDASGNVLWAKSAGGLAYDIINSIAVDASGNVFISGSYSSASITFGTTTITNASGTGTYCIFIAKFNSSGTALWAKSPGGNSQDNVNGLTTDASGNAYITGEFSSSSLTFGTSTITNSVPTNSLIYIAKYDANGNALWAKTPGGTANDGGTGVTVDATGNIYVTGYFYSPSLTFGSTTLTKVGTSTTTSDIFVTKYNASGTALWAKSFGGNYNENGGEITCDPSGNIYITGTYNSDSIFFDTTKLKNGTNGSNPFIFLSKLNASGNVVWARSAGSSGGGNYANDLVADANGNVYLTGYFSSGFIFFGTTIISVGATTNKIFFAKYNSSGNIDWAYGAGSSGSNIASSIAMDGSNNIYIAGNFTGSSITFASTVLNNSSTSADIFLSKFNLISGVEEQTSYSAGISVYPNPASNEINIESKSTEKLNVQLFDITGKNLTSTIPFINSTAINTQPLSEGIYFLRITNEQSELVKTMKVSVVK